MAKKQGQINKQGQKYIAALARTVQQLWRQMCVDVGISPDEKFVDLELLKKSKLHPFYEKAMAEYLETVNQYRAGGYVGLRIGKRVI
jgi:hypothetical protein